MAVEWQLRLLGDVLSFANGKTSPERTDGGKFFVFGSNGPIGRSDLRNSPENTIVIGRVGSYCGSTFFSKAECWVTDNAIRANAKAGNDAIFAYYLLQTLNLNERRAGSGQPLLNQSILSTIDVAVPPLEEQHAIAETLSALDDRIDNLRQANATLQAIAAALFKSRFVDFDGVPPEDMQESELGLIPKGWQVASLEEHEDAERGLSYKGAGLAEAGAGVPMHNLNSVLEFGGYKYAGIKYYSGDYKEKHLAVAGDIIVANTEQGHEHRLIGFPAIVPGSYTSGLFSHHLYRVRIKVDSPITREWLYHCLMAPSVREQIIGCANGSTVNMLKPDGLKIPRFALPPHELCETFDAVAAPLRLKAEANVEQMETLAALRDALLPRLISGQLRVSQ